MSALGRSKQRFDFTSERRVIDLHFDGGEDSEVSGYFFTTDDLDDISSDKLLGGQLCDFSLSEDLGC